MAHDETFNQLQLIRQRLERIEHTQEILVRAEKEKILEEIYAAVDADPTLGEVFLLIDGNRGQADIVTEMEANGLENASQPSVSRRLSTLQALHLVEPMDKRGGTLIYRKSGIDQILGLTRRIRTHLAR